MSQAEKFSSFSMPLVEAMTTQRAIRRIKPDPVDDEIILELIELALKGPTAQDEQGWEFVVVKDRATKAVFARQARFMWRLYAPLANRRFRGDEKKLRMYRAVQWSVDHFEDIPVYIVACFRGSRLGFPPVVGSSTYGSIFPAVQNILLAARAAGLGANLVTLPLWSNFIARRILGLPFGLTPAAMIPIGWPIGRYGPTTRPPVGQVVSLDRYGNKPWQQGG
jgi:nitroreductase